MPLNRNVNLRFKRKLIEIANKGGRDAKEGLWCMCARDFLFFLGAFVWIYEPREPGKPPFPFIPFRYQIDAGGQMLEHIGRKHMNWPKSRDKGVSWLWVAFCVWLFVFHNMVMMAFISRNERFVDSANNPAAMMTRFDFIIRCLPKWMQPVVSGRHMHRFNILNGSVVDGETTTSDSLRQDRRFLALVEEAPTIRELEEMIGGMWAVTNSIITIGTLKPTSEPGGRTFHARCLDRAIHQVVLHWTQDPRHNKGLYAAAVMLPELRKHLDEMPDPVQEAVRNESYEIRGDVVHFDPTYKYPDDYEYTVDRCIRSLYYDKACRELSALQVAEELDVDLQLTGRAYFEQATLDYQEENFMRPPMRVGALEKEGKLCRPVQFRDDVTGYLYLWCELTRGRPPSGDYILAADIGAGTGASNSSAFLMDRHTSEQVAEYTRPDQPPTDFAEDCVAIARWFWNAYVIAEANAGFGLNFLQRIISPTRCNYPSIFFRQDDNSLSHRPSDKPGWWSTRQTKKQMLENCAASMRAGEIKVRSEWFLKDAADYVWLPNGTVGHKGSVNTQDPSGAKDNHGDRVIGGGLAVLIQDRYPARAVVSEEKIPSDSMYARIMGSERDRQKKVRFGYVAQAKHPVLGEFYTYI